MITRLTLDRYVYEDIYPAFKEATDEKEITAKLSRDCLNYLAQRNLILTGATPAAVADIGCGPCDTLIMYLRGVLLSQDSSSGRPTISPSMLMRNAAKRCKC